MYFSAADLVKKSAAQLIVKEAMSTLKQKLNLN